MDQNKNKITQVKEAILTAPENSSLKDIVDSDKKAFNGIRMLYSTNAAGAQLQIDESLEHLFTGVFSKKRLLAYSDSIRTEMEEGTSVICFKQRALFDTNLLSDLPKYFKGAEFSTRKKVEKVIEAVSEVYGGGFDYSFPMLENLREFTCANNPYPVAKVSAAIYFDNKLRGNLTSSSNQDDLFAPYIEQAESVWMSYRSNQHTWNMIDRRDLIYAVMLKTFQLCWTTNNITIEIALNNLIEYCLNELGVLPLKELYFAWKAVIGFSVGYFTPVFDEKLLKSPKSKSVDRIGALAWDLFIFRFTETLLTEEKENNFYIPSVTTLDKGLLSTIVSCPAKAMISFPDLKYVETIFEDELQFQQCLNSSMSAKQRDRITDPNRGIKGSKRLRHYMSVSIANLEKSINRLV
ncbi:hypothetical protein [Pseudoalteromonas simplex]|jgi:hypothetical protein|uniref:hypothetical protein n=2 Tax=Pseudoalteromonas TaxID=53246 RepID=UPI00188901A4|nr:hypothetical protein [Pseudoalteromonas sp. A520]